MDILLQKANALANQPALPVIPIPNRIAYVVSHGQSYASNGYAIRTQGIAKALNDHGFETLCFVRPGRPWELGVEKGSVQPEVVVDGVRYIHSRWTNDERPSGEVERLQKTVDQLIALFRIYRPQVVLAASNHEIAIPAYVAARILGLPFQYEVRGFWEISRASREPGWENTQAFKEHYERENWVCNQADQLYTLNRQMQQELASRGAKPSNVRLVPNSVTHIPAPLPSGNPALRRSLTIPENAYVVGYIGAITEYEGLDQLLDALAILKDQSVHALIVGGYSPVNNQASADQAPIWNHLKTKINTLGLEQQVTFTGRVPHEALPEYFAAIDATVIPRNPLPVCELVSAIKPLEYLSYGKPVIASDVAPQAELLEQGRLGWLYQKGNSQALADTIRLVRNESEQEIHSKTSAAIARVQEKYLWQNSVLPLVSGLRNAERLQGKRPRIACIMDDFTYQSYAPEADFYQLTPNNWKEELEACQPEMLFIESAWRGKDELWGSKVGHKSQEVQGIVQWCSEHNVPTIFWNKEDPVHFETFLNTAKLFDHVFTTDLDCIHRYKAALGHNRVYFLPFASQPRLTNPIETYQRKDAFCFAGAYYVRYPDRTKDLETFVEEFPKFKPLEIYDRNYGKNDPNYQFPENYQPYIVGTLPFSEIDKAYKGYRYAINLNSIKQSQTMFARRVFELLGSNTITVSNFSRGVRLMFGDLVLTSDSGAEIVNRLRQLEENPLTADKFRLAGLRKVLREHTYQQRLDYILSKVTGKEYSHPLPGYTVISPVSNDHQLKNTLANFKRQNHINKELLVITSDGYSPKQAQGLIASENLQAQVSCLDINEIGTRELRELAGEKRWAAAFHPADYYGPNYLTDLALATRFSKAPIVGKSAFFQATDGACQLQNNERAYKAGVDLPVRASAQAPQTQVIPAKNWIQGIESGWHSSDNQQAIDPFNYAWNGQESSNLIELQHTVDDHEFDEGIPLQQLIELAERTEPKGATDEQIPSYSSEKVQRIFDNPGTNNVQLQLTAEGLQITSHLADGKHEYVYVKEGNDLPLEQLMPPESSDGKLRLHLETTPGLNLSLVVIFFSDKGERLHHNIIQANKNNELEVPEGTAKVRLGFRVYQSGESIVKKLLLGKKDLSPNSVLGRSDVLLLTNHYPSYEDLYRNGFVHTRVKAYQEKGVNVDVFRFRKDQPVSWHEFQNIDVITGSDTALRRMLETGQYRHVLVHFLDAEMWSVLGDFIDSLKVTVWVHGADIQPWYRRKFNIETPEQEEKAKEQSEKRMAFWRSILQPMHRNLQLVFVSNYFAEEVMEDLGFRLPKDQYHIIHNPINTDLFRYQEKDPEQRKKILSIRPFASRVYANDLTVKCILELSKEPFFDELEFRIIGDGKLFDETVEPLRKFQNVIIEKKFLSQNEIAELHRIYGVFLCPSRMDTQGVSRDEAMASGLVPITNRAGAIPEFVNSENGILCEAESYSELSLAIKNLYSDPTYYTSLSHMAASSVNSNRAGKLVIESELKVIGK